MNEIAIIIPSRLDAERLPNKPLKLINNKEMILHVYEAANRANIGKVFVATPDQKILDLIKKNGGNAFITNYDHATGTDRVYEVFSKYLKKKPDIIINLQGDMPNIDPKAIKTLAEHMNKGSCEIGTLASELDLKTYEKDENVVKLVTLEDLESNKFSKTVDFFRLSKENYNKKIYHHIGIYAFTNKALIKYVGLKRSKLELDRKLEQLRALENNMIIEAGYIKSYPLSIDTEQDLIKIKDLMEN